MHDDGRKNKVVVVFVLTGFGDADTSSEIQSLELRPELMPRAFPFVDEREWCGSSSAICAAVLVCGCKAPSSACVRFTCR